MNVDNTDKKISVRFAFSGALWKSKYFSVDT